MNMYIYPPLVVLVATGIGVGYAMGYVGDDPYQQLAIFLTVLTIGLAGAIFLIQFEQNRKSTDLVKKMDTRDRNLNDQRNERKIAQEKRYVHALVEIRKEVIEIMDLAGKIVNIDSLEHEDHTPYNYKEKREFEKETESKIKEKWQKLQKSGVDRLEFLNTTSFDVVKHEIVDDVEWIKNMMKNELSDSAGGIVSQLHVIENQLDNLMQGDLKDRRLEVREQQQQRVDAEIASYTGETEAWVNLQKKHYKYLMSFFDYSGDPPRS